MPDVKEGIIYAGKKNEVILVDNLYQIQIGRIIKSCEPERL
jgi:hypothetical protein